MYTIVQSLVQKQLFMYKFGDSHHYFLLYTFVLYKMDGVGVYCLF